MVEEIIIHQHRGHILAVDGKFYKLVKEGVDDQGRTITKQFYKEVDPKTYHHDLWNLARRLEEEAPVKLIDIIVDALKDLPLDRVSRLEDALMKARAEEKKLKPVYTGGCVEIQVGDEFLVLRE